MSLRLETAVTLITAGLVAFCLSTTTAAMADPEVSSAEMTNGDSATRAARHFDDGLAFVAQGALEQAVDAFIRAYEISPHYSVLYNLGLAYAALERPKPAVAALQRYLSEGGEAIASERVEAVERKIAEQRALLGRIAVQVNPPDAQVSIDGVAVPRAASAEVTEGVHVVRVERHGFSPATHEVTVRSGVSTELHVTLLPHRRVQLECAIPDVTVSYQGNALATSTGTRPIELILPHATVELVLKRPGYRSQHIELPPETRAVRCELDANEAITPLVVSLNEPEAELFLDGKPFRNGTPVVPGRHLLSANLNGFISRSLLIDASSAGTHRVRLQLRPLERVRRSYESEALATRRMSYWLGGAGLAVATAGAGILAYNEVRFGDWRSRRQELPEDPQTPEHRAAVRELDRVQGSIEAWDTSAWVVLGLGSTIAASGVIVYLLGNDPERYKETALVVAPGGIWVTGRF